MGLSLEQRKIIEERRKEVEIRTKAGETIEQIATALNITEGLVSKDRTFLRKNGILEIENIEEKVQEQMQQIKRLAEAGKTEQEIAKEVGLSKARVSQYKRRLRDEGNLNILSSEQRQQIVEEEIKARKTAKQIKKETGISKTAIVRYKKKLREQGKLTGKEKPETQSEKQIKRRTKKIKKMIEDEKTNKEMEEELGVSRSTIFRGKRILREQEIAQLSERVKKLYENFYGQDDTIEKFEEYLTLCKERYEQKMIDEKDLIAIKCAAISTQRYENIVFYIKLCIRFNQFEEAIKFAHDYINYETFSQEEKEKIKKSKEECQKYFKAINMIKQKINDEQIKEISGVSKVELAILKKKVEKQDNKDKKIGSNGENENSEELSL